ncbi:DgyrCDS13736 [Dimorphilus gyrociliatus]|uniref:BK channel n=1 Tax=Dimorphilus gyrociliatus TaxID=2664684 RepID=A0A7I8WBT4_9ANNE|nr:DgyrCDS13736 [Dimorphilus gyrociliatus]
MKRVSNHQTILPSNGSTNCLSERQWHYFLASSLITFALGLFILLLYKLIAFSCSRWSRRRKERNENTGQVEAVSFMTKLKWMAERWISGQTVTGRILVSLSCVLSIGSLIIYLIDASRFGKKVEQCKSWTESPAQQIDFVFNVFFTFYFIIRFTAANDKLIFWLEMHSIVDYFTILPAYMAIYLGRQWLGFRFLRALRLISFPDILQYLSLLRTSNKIRLAQLLSMFFGVWLAAAGFVHLVENSGDPFHDWKNSQYLSYWDCLYFLMVTMSTVGYGDIYCVTDIGRTFIVFFLLFALAIFASSVPEILDIVGKHPRYGGTYEKPAGVRHIVVTGHISYESVKNFLRDFLHEDRENKNVKCLFLDSKNPDLELEALFKRHFTQVCFFKGSPLNTNDLERVKLKLADAFLVVADPRASDPDAEDAANIMRVISAKNYHSDIRIIIQLMRFHNKAFLVNLPSWMAQDQIICLAEMKLGFMAQSCLAPGFSTLMANLFAMRSYKKSEKAAKWQDDYLRGAGMEMYSSYLSEALHGHTFPQAVEICFCKLKLLLIAISVYSEDGEDYQVVLNAGIDYIIDRDTKAFFICESEEEVKRAQNFCKHCHWYEKNIRKIVKCNCSKQDKSTIPVATCKQQDSPSTTPTSDKSADDVLPNPYCRRIQIDITNHSRSNSQSPTSPDAPEVFNSTLNTKSLSAIVPHVLAQKRQQQEERKMIKCVEHFDSTGLFHWCDERKFEEAVLSHRKNRDLLKKLNKHIVVCLFGDHKSPLIGLCNFVMPLRASSFKLDDVKTIVFVGNEEYLRKEWHSLENFPDVYVKPGSPLNRADLRTIKINQCHMCVILTASDCRSDDITLVDKEAILCSLNIKTMTFQNVADVWKCASPRRTLATLALLRDARSLTHRPTTGACIPMITELDNDINAQFLDQDDEDDPEMPLYMTQPFACGRAFAASVLDSLMSTMFFNPDAMHIIRSLITGGATNEFDHIMAEGVGVVKGDSSNDSILTRDRCRVAQLTLEDSYLERYSYSSYGTLFIKALRHYGILCLGLYRQIDPRPSAGSYNRCVVTNPPSDFALYPSDKVLYFQYPN